MIGYEDGECTARNYIGQCFFMTDDLPETGFYTQVSGDAVTLEQDCISQDGVWTTL